MHTFYSKQKSEKCVVLTLSAENWMCNLYTHQRSPLHIFYSLFAFLWEWKHVQLFSMQNYFILHLFNIKGKLTSRYYPEYYFIDIRFPLSLHFMADFSLADQFGTTSIIPNFSNIYCKHSYSAIFSNFSYRVEWNFRAFLTQG